ncbi:class I SAM-dependent methyltransferase [Halolamina salifodinae]|uniref:SAM-dependent methyltransferase n=1 Tax=Halolamina salifodinae TaxID=1202767 RepID=A0A8T4GUH2_9EURY|nr:class I SAM-dependent methyltransferase [Halolamina salifodinae]MBP1986687.1 SAM-dependent methyltransferase [Halolamina salifodinae]
MGWDAYRADGGDDAEAMRDAGKRNVDRLERFYDEPPASLASVGCGTGELALTYGERHPEATVVGYDASPVAVEPDGYLIATYPSPSTRALYRKQADDPETSFLTDRFRKVLDGESVLTEAEIESALGVPTRSLARRRRPRSRRGGRDAAVCRRTAATVNAVHGRPLSLFL